MPSMQFRHPPRRRPLSAAPKSCRMPRGRAQGCGSVRLAFSRPTAHPPPVVGADSISARGPLPRRGVRRDEGIPPYGRPGGGGRPGWSQSTKFIRRGGIHPARGRPRHRRVPGTMQASSPTEVRYNAGVPFGRGPSVGRRGGIYCARRRVSEANRRAAAALRPEIPPAGPCAAANRADMESAPTKVCYNAGLRFPRWPGVTPGL